MKWPTLGDWLALAAYYVLLIVIVLMWRSSANNAPHMIHVEQAHQPITEIINL